MLIIGNGESRKGIDLEQYKCEKIGCNAIFRQHKVRHIVCLDRRMAQEAVKNMVNLKSGIWTRPDWHHEFKGKHNVNAVPSLWYSPETKADEAFHWGSGPFAIYLGLYFYKKEPLDIIGFDLYSKDSQINNIFKGTRNYESADSKAVDPRFWVHQIAKLIEKFSDRTFRFYNTPDWELPDSWNKPNVQKLNLSELDKNV
jgi:hypothetical protein